MSTSDVYIGMLFTFGIASAIISAIVCAMIAYQRGLNVGGWLVLGFFIPLFSILFITITPLNHKKLRERGIEARTHKRCSECAEIVKVKAKKCRYCHSVFEV